MPTGSWGNATIMTVGSITIDALRGLDLVIVGAGVTGKALHDFALSHGALVSMVDDRVDGALRSLPERCALAIISPGWRPDHPVIEEIRARGIPHLSEIDFAWEMKRQIAPEQRWIGLSGTNGKTTTIQMVENIMRSAGVAGVACGNVGRTVIESITPEIDILAIELSSFQIDWSELPRFEAIALLNISPDHIDWHGSFDRYRDAKLKLISLSKRSFINISDATLSRSWPELTTASNSDLIPFHLGSPASGEIGLVEDLIVDRALVDDPMHAQVLVEVAVLPSSASHNVSNAMAAAALSKAIGIGADAITRGLATFVLDQHRLQVIGESKGVTWVDDSKATNPHAAMAAIFSFPSVIWIAGGLAKGASMDELVRATSSRVRAAILVGRDAPLIRAALEELNPSVKIVEVGATQGREVMREAVTFAKNLASRGDTVLLAPACASMDQFTSYKERGDLFQGAVKELVLSEGGAP
jgi:UDP-N-acetylmuramoylalanine--D-glutamate ligase